MSEISKSELDKLITEFDCTVCFKPHIGSKGVTVSTLDGYCIVIDESLSPECVTEVVEHELWHIILGHLDEYKYLPDWQKELEVKLNMKGVDKRKLQ